MVQINVDHWPKSSFVTVNGKRPDTWYCQYVVGKIKPNYPVPAIPYEVQHNEASICIFHRSGSCEHDVYILQTI